MPDPLVLVRKIVCYPVPPVCSIYWTTADWQKTARVTAEPLVLDGPSGIWVATGERNAQGQLLYKKGIN